MGLYSIVAWPTAEFAEWIERLQKKFGINSYGKAHLNLRIPFQYSGSEKELIAAVRAALEGTSAFEVEFLRWRRFPHVVFVEYALNDPLRELHQKLLALPGIEVSAYDGEHFIPHISLAVGLCSWAEEDVWESLQTIKLPQEGFQITAASLTLEAGGELRELHTFPLQLPELPNEAGYEVGFQEAPVWADAGDLPLA